MSTLSLKKLVVGQELYVFCDEHGPWAPAEVVKTNANSVVVQPKDWTTTVTIDKTGVPTRCKLKHGRKKAFQLLGPRRNNRRSRSSASDQRASSPTFTTPPRPTAKARRCGRGPNSATKQNSTRPPLHERSIFKLKGGAYEGYVLRSDRSGIMVGFKIEKSNEWDGRGYLYKSVESYNSKDLHDATIIEYNPNHYLSKAATVVFPSGIQNASNTIDSDGVHVFQLQQSPGRNNTRGTSSQQTTLQDSSINNQIVFPASKNVPKKKEVHKQSSTKSLPMSSRMEIHYNNKTPTIVVTIGKEDNIDLRGSDCKASFTAKSSNLDDVKATFKHALLYSHLARMHKGNGGYKLPQTMHRFEDEQLLEMSLCSVSATKNNAPCLESIAHKEWNAIKIGSEHVYRFTTKNLNTKFNRMFPQFTTTKVLESKIRVKGKRQRKRLRGTGTTTNTRTNNNTSGPTVLDDALHQAQKATFNARFVSKSSKSNKKHSVANDETFSISDLQLLFGNKAASIHSLAEVLEKQFNSKKANEILKMAGISTPTLGDHIAYYFANNIVAVTQGVIKRLKKDQKRDPTEEMLETLLATADPVGAFQKLENDPLKAFLLTLAFRNFDATRAVDGSNKKNMARGAFKNDRTNNVKGFEKKAEKLLAAISILSNVIDPTNQTGNNVAKRNFLGLKIELDPAEAGVSNSTHNTISKCGLVPGKETMDHNMRMMENAISIFWSWEVHHHTDDVSGELNDDKSRGVYTVHGDNVDMKGARGAGNDKHFVAIGATKGIGRFSKEERDLINAGIRSRKGPNNDTDTSTPQSDDWEMMVMSECEKKAQKLHNMRRILMALHVCALDQFDNVAPDVPLWDEDDAVDVRLAGSNVWVPGKIKFWDQVTKEYCAVYRLGGQKEVETNFTSDRVRARVGESRDNRIDVDAESEDEESAATTPPTDANSEQQQQRTFVEPQCTPSETILVHLMKETSSKHYEAAEQMEAAMRNAMEKHNFQAKGSAMFVVEDFEFYKKLIEKYLLNVESTTVPELALGHLAKSLAVQILSFYEDLTTRPLLVATGIEYMSSRYQSLFKGTHITGTVREVLRQGHVGLLSLAKVFLKQKGTAVFHTKSDNTTFTVQQYLSNPELLMHDASTTVDYVLGFDGRPIPYVMDKHGVDVVELFLQFLNEELIQVPPANAPASETQASNKEEEENATPATASVTPLELEIYETLNVRQVKQRCQDHADACEEFEWKNVEKNHGVLRARLLSFESNGKNAAAATISNQISAAVVREKVEGKEIPTGANLNLKMLIQMVLVDTANLAMLVLATRVVANPPPAVQFNSTCSCKYAHNRCFCDFKWWIAIKVVCQSTFLHRQYNYQISLIYAMLQVIGFSNNSNDKFISLIMHQITQSTAVSAWGNANRAGPVDLEQERDCVLRVKEMYRKVRSDHITTGIRAILHSHRTILQRRQQHLKFKASGEIRPSVFEEKKAKVTAEYVALTKQIACMDTMVEEILSNNVAVVVGTGTQFSNGKRLWNLLYTGYRQMLKAMQQVCRAMEAGLCTSLPKDPVVPPRTIGKLVASKDKKKVEARKKREQEKKTEQARMVALEVLHAKVLVVPDSLGMLEDTRADAQKASMVIEIARRLLVGAENDHVNRAHAGKLLHTFSGRPEQHNYLYSVAGTGARRNGGGWIKFVDILQELQLVPNFRVTADNTSVPFSYRELARAMLVQFLRHFKGGSTQGVVICMDTAEYMTVLRGIVQEKRGKKQDSKEQQRSMYRDIDPDDLFEEQGSWTVQMKRKYGMVEFIAHLIAFEMLNVDETSGWNFARLLQQVSGSTHAFLIFIGGAAVVEVVTGATRTTMDTFNDDVQIQVFADTNTISAGDVVKLLSNVYKQAEGERMIATATWLLVVWGMSQLKNNKHYSPKILWISNDADTLDAHAMPTIHALLTIQKRYLPNRMRVNLLLEVKAKSTQVLKEMGALEAQRRRYSGEGGGITPNGRQLLTFIDIQALYFAIESFNELPEYDEPGLRALSFCDGVFLMGGSDYVPALKFLSYKRLLNTMASSQYRSYVAQVRGAGGSVPLFNITPPVGFEERLNVRDLNLVTDPDPDGTLAPKFTANVHGRNLLQWAAVTQQKRTRAHLEKVFGRDVLKKLQHKINIDVLLVSAKIAGDVIPLGEGATLTRRAEENGSDAQYANFIFQADPTANVVSPLNSSPFYLNADGWIRRRLRPDPRGGTAQMTTLEARAIGHFGRVYHTVELPPAVLRFWPYRSLHAIVNDAMSDRDGKEAPRTVKIEDVQPKRAASTVAEVDLFQSGGGKFADTKEDDELFFLVVTNTLVNKTSYIRLPKRSKLVKIIGDRKRKYTNEIGE